MRLTLHSPIDRRKCVEFELSDPPARRFHRANATQNVSAGPREN